MNQQSPLMRHSLPSLAMLAMVSVAALAAAPKSELSQPEGVPPHLRLISQEQYTNTMANVFGTGINVSLRLPPVRRIGGLTAIGSSSTIVTPGAFEQIENSARLIAAQVVNEPHRSFLFPCRPKAENLPDDRCARQFFTKTGRLLFRRPLTREELAQYVKSARSNSGPAGGFYQGVAYSLTGMLVSPQFVLIADRIEADPQAPGKVRLDAFSIAARLSLLLWNSYPDDRLLAAAESGELHSQEELARQVDRMLASPLLEAGIRAFFSDMLRFDTFDLLAKDQIIYPAFSKQVAIDAREETLRVIVDHVINQDRDYRELFTTQKTFMTSSLAALYRVPLDNPKSWNEYDLDGRDERGGLLTQISFLALHGHEGRSSPTLRGKALREVFLCQRVPPPPPNVDFSRINDMGEHLKTARDRLGVHSEDPVCAGCHKVTDPIGLGLEAFDGAGQFRTTEGGATINTEGALDGRKFSDAAELGRALFNHPAATKCLVNRLYSYGVGREINAAESEPVAALVEEFSSDGFRVRSLLRRIATSGAFYAVAAPEPIATPTRDVLAHQTR